MVSNVVRMPPLLPSGVESMSHAVRTWISPANLMMLSRMVLCILRLNVLQAVVS